MAYTHISVGSVYKSKYLVTPTMKERPIEVPHTLLHEVGESTIVKEDPDLRFTSRYGYSYSLSEKKCLLGLRALSIMTVSLIFVFKGPINLKKQSFVVLLI